ncbi:MAG: hypothetical protein ACREVJ_01575, partial [Gammaproteobacteria bacterium]
KSSSYASARGAKFRGFWRLARVKAKREGRLSGQAILTLRALHQSERFEPAWKLLFSTYKRIVTIPENVVRFPKRTVH